MIPPRSSCYSQRAWTVATTTKHAASRDDEWFKAPFSNEAVRRADTVPHGCRIPRAIRRPHPDTPFDAHQHLGVSDCSYPEWPELEMLALVPKRILERFDCVGESVHDGQFATVQPADHAAFVTGLEAAGFICHRHDWLVEAAKDLIDKWPDDA